jgi:hypothetical protein
MRAAKKKRTVAKTAISLPSDLLEHAQQMVRQGIAPSLSGYFAALARRDRQRRDFSRFVAELEDELGMTDADRARIDHELGFTRPTRKAG